MTSTTTVIEEEVFSEMSARYGQVSVDEFAMHAPFELGFADEPHALHAKQRFDWAEAMYEESQRRLLQEEHAAPLARMIAELGTDSTSNTKERAARLLEEVLEHCQAAGLTWEDVNKQSTHTFAKPANADPIEELADVWITLLVGAHAYGKQIYDLEQLAKAKLESLPKDYIKKRAHMKQFNGSLSFTTAPIPTSASASDG